MRRTWSLALGLLLISGCGASPPSLPAADAGYQAMTRATQAGPARILVGVQGLGAAACRSLGRAHGLELERMLPLGVARFALAGATAASLGRLARTAGVRYVEGDAAGQVWGEAPDDPLYGEQWDMQRMQVAAAWEIREGGDATVAVVDTGVDRQHPELRERLEAGTAVTGGEPDDDLGHGTAVAGIVAATPCNGEGLVGVALRARIMPVKVNVPGTGQVRASDAAAGIVWAVEHGAHVINLSLGFTAGEPGLEPAGLRTLHDAVAMALQQGVAVVCAAGNISGTSRTSYPAAWAGTELPDLIAVGALDRADRRAGYSNFGPWLTVTAPADDVPALTPGGYGRFGGTSAAAPHVSGLLALLITPSRPPSLKTLRSWITRSARDLGAAGVDAQFGAGAVDALAAVRMSTR